MFGTEKPIPHTPRSKSDDDPCNDCFSCIYGSNPPTTRKPPTPAPSTKSARKSELAQPTEMTRSMKTGTGSATHPQQHRPSFDLPTSPIRSGPAVDLFGTLFVGKLGRWVAPQTRRLPIPTRATTSSLGGTRTRMEPLHPGATLKGDSSFCPRTWHPRKSSQAIMQPIHIRCGQLSVKHRCAHHAHGPHSAPAAGGSSGTKAPLHRVDHHRGRSRRRGRQPGAAALHHGSHGAAKH